MPRFEVPVRVFDPATPFETHAVERPVLDSWHSSVLVHRRVLDRIPALEVVGRGEVPTSGGLGMMADIVEVGLQLGDLRLPRVQAMRVDSGRNDLVLGHKVVEQALRLGGGGAQVFSAAREDPKTMALELRPLDPALELGRVLAFLGALQELFALAVLGAEDTPTPPPTLLDGGEDLSAALTPSQRLAVTWMGSDPPSLCLGSSRLQELATMARVLRVDAAAELASEVADILDRSSRTMILAEKRNQTATAMHAQAVQLRADPGQAHAAWVQELDERLGFLARRGERLGARDLVEGFDARVRAARQRLVGARLLPVCRRIPRLG